MVCLSNESLRFKALQLLRGVDQGFLRKGKVELYPREQVSQIGRKFGRCQWCFGYGDAFVLADLFAASAMRIRPIVRKEATPGEIQKVVWPLDWH